MIDLAKVAKEETEKIRHNRAIKVLKEEIELEDAIRKSIKHGMHFTYLDTTLLINETGVVREALEIFGYKTTRRVGHYDKTELKVEW